MKSQIIFTTLSLLFSLNVMAEKYALIIAVGDYPKRTGWSSISSVNDVSLIKNTLLKREFNEEHIFVLENEDATKTGILKAIGNLQQLIKPGDIVVIHYSGHGQQIFDDNGDEVDDLDEAIVPYDALAKYMDNYKGENHIRDDELGDIIANFRNVLGNTGQLLVLFDSCHSGSATRGGLARGGSAPFAPVGWKPGSNKNKVESGFIERIEVNEDAAPFIFISGASADELNYEYGGYGSLSFAFSKAMNELGSKFSYRQLYAKIASVMNAIAPNQTPTIEGDQDYILFNDEYLKQQDYFPVLDIPKKDVVKIQAGKIHGIFEGTTVNILPAGTNTFSEDLVLSSGTVLMSKFNQANIQLDKPLESTKENDYWVFINQKTYGDINLNVFFGKKVEDKKVQNDIGNFLKENNLGSVVKDSINSDVYISQNNSRYTLNVTNDMVEFANEDKNRGEEGLTTLKEQLFNFAQGQYLKTLNMDNENYQFKFRLLPVEYDIVMEKFGDTLSPQTFTNASGVFTVRPKLDQVVLEVTNESKNPIYISLIEINSKGEINPFFPNNECNLTDDDRKIPPGATMIFRDCIFSFESPYEKLMIKGFASPNPINFKSTVQSRGEATRSNSSPLEKLVGQTYVKSRSGTGNKTSEKIDGYSTEMIYEIVENKN